MSLIVFAFLTVAPEVSALLRTGRLSVGVFGYGG